MTEAGRLNVGVSRHKNMFVLVGDYDCLETDEALPEDDEDPDGEVITRSWDSKLEELFTIYRTANVVGISIDPS